MGWRNAVTTLSGISVSGVVTSYDLDEMPGMLPAAELPALVPVFPGDAGESRDDARGLAVLTCDGGVWTSTLRLDHYLYWSPAPMGRGLMDVLPDIISAVDAYLAAVGADGLLSGALSSELVVERVQVGVWDYGGVDYYGARFRHRWTRTVSTV